MAGGSLDEVPTQAIAHGTHTSAGQKAIVSLCKAIVICGGNDVDLTLLWAPVGGTFEAAQKEALEEGRWPGIHAETAKRRRNCIRAHVVKIVIVSPHRDDAAFSLGLSVERWLSSGHTVQVLNCFTQSEYAPYSDAESLHSNDRRSFVSALRKREDVAWNKMLGGRLQITDLDLLDAPLRLACGVDEVLALEIRPGDRAVSRVAGAIAKAARNGAALAIPLAIGGHFDHRVTHQAALEALQTSSAAFAFYEDLPYAARPGAAEEIAILAGRAGLDLQPSFVAEPSPEPQARRDRKYRAIQCYDSQVDSVVAAQIAEFSTRYDGRERLWANPAWCAAGLEHEPSGELEA